MEIKGLIDSQMEKNAIKRTPLICHFDLSYHCNLNCVHCYVEKEDRPELTTPEIKDILNQLASAGVLYLNFSGGEIFTRPDFFEIAEHARKLHFALILSTNGTLIDEKIADKIAKLNPLKVKITIFSTSPETHDNITTVKGSLEKSLKSIEMLNKRNLTVQVTQILIKTNINDFHDVYHLTQQLKTDFKVDYQITPKINGNSENVNYQISSSEERQILADPILKLNYEPQLSDSHKKSFYDDVFCDAGLISFYISPYGDVYPCIQFQVLCGNLKNDSFEDIWNQSPAMQKVASLRTTDLVCADCELRKYCTFCPGLAYFETKNPLAPYPQACNQSQILYEISCLK